MTVRTFLLIALLAFVSGLGGSLPSTAGWGVYAYREGAFVPVSTDQQYRLPSASSPAPATCALADLPASWQIRGARYADLTADGAPECVFLVWRPWADWPIMRWSDAPSPIADHRDAGGDSAHIILIEPLSAEPAQRRGRSYHKVWAGSALAAPVVQMAVGDVNGDGRNELIVLEGDYATGRDGPAYQMAVWRWNGFGFTLAWRSRLDTPLTGLAVIDLNGDGAAEILVR